jgi:hypothetical protein
MPTIGQEQADRFSSKLQAFYDGLPEDERPLMKQIMFQAAGEPEVSGYETTAVLGSSGKIVFTLTPSVGSDAINKQHNQFPGAHEGGSTGVTPSIGIGFRF